MIEDFAQFLYISYKYVNNIVNGIEWLNLDEVERHRFRKQALFLAKNYDIKPKSTK